MAAVVALLTALVAPLTAAATPPSGVVVVANRGSGDISVIDTATLAVTNIDLPGEAEPMYVSHDTRNDRVLVGDRASSTVVVFDDESFAVIGSVAVGAGIFHQWLDADREQLWVVGTTGATVSVVDTTSLELMATFELPADVVDAGGIPHDVFVSNNNAFVSVVGLASDGLVIQYSTNTLTETGRIATGGDPHLFVRSNKLYVASQDASTLSRYQATTLKPLGTIAVPAAHGLFVSDRNEVLATNIAGAGIDAVWELDTQLTAITAVANTDFAVPHNLAVDNSRQLWVTHSGGTADQVSVLPLTNDGFGSPTAVIVGTNPFGLAFVG
jgi:DNA-binding beta-propeller fold protein YncE